MEYKEIDNIFNKVKDGNGARLEFSQKTMLLIPEDGQVLARLEDSYGNIDDIAEDTAKDLLSEVLEVPTVVFRDIEDEN